MTSRYLNADQSLQASSLCNGFYTEFVYNFNQLFMEKCPLPVPTDITECLRRILSIFRTSPGMVRFFGHPVNYIVKHAATLRHRAGTSKIKISTVIKCIEHLADILVLLNLYYREDARANLYYNTTCTFYMAYYDMGHSLNVPYLGPKEFSTLRPIETAPSPWVPTSSSGGGIFALGPSELPPCPQGQTIAWYKSNGYARFLTNKIWIPQFGLTAGERCVLQRYNGKNSLVRYGPNWTRFKYLKSDVPICWVDPRDIESI
jgi:hypothetical protein